jgi:hypothetical protein
LRCRFGGAEEDRMAKQEQHAAQRGAAAKQGAGKRAEST